MKSVLVLLLVISLAVRMLYFPHNVYFAYDQARDAFTALELLKGDVKIIGPPSAISDKLFAGPLAYYLYAPIYFLFHHNPEVVAVALRIINALGVLLVFAIGTTMFRKRVGVVAALLFAFSYEQSQYALFISHQPLAVVPVLLLYFGLSRAIFKNDQRCLILAGLGWGLAIQFHYVYILLAPIIILLFVIFRRCLLPITPRYIMLSFLVFTITIASYIIAEIHFGFRFLSTFVTSASSQTLYPQAVMYATNRFIHDIFIANNSLVPFASLLLVATAGYFITRSKKTRPYILFLTIWFIGGLTPHLISGTPSYYYSAGASVSLLLFIAYTINYFFTHQKTVIGVLLMMGIIANNLYLITTTNRRGLNADMVIQPEMLVSYEKQALDYIYIKAQGQPFAINALTIPLNVNTTWSYLFEWYGKQRYGYIPVWGGNAAQGYAGNLTVITARSQLPTKRFTIIEPTIGMREHDKKQFFEEEGYFSQVVEEKKFGPITVQLRQPI